MRDLLSNWRHLLIVCGLALTASWVWAADKAPVDVDDVPVSAPPVGKPQNRIGAGSRSGDKEALADDIEVFLIAPAQLGATAQPQPVIYWYLTRTTEADIDFVITESQNDQGRPSSDVPLMKKVYAGQTKAGLHSTSLASEQTTLSKNVQYRVTVVAHTTKDNSTDPFSSGYLIYTDRPATVSQNSDGRALAGAGLWYDAIDAMVNACCHDPSQASPRKQLCGLAWSQHVFYTLPQDKAAEQAADAKAKQLAGEKEATRLKQFEKFIENTQTAK